MPPAAINDLSFRYPYQNRSLANDALHRLLRCYQELRKDKYRKRDVIYGATIDAQTELAPNVKLIQLIQDFETRDDQRLLLTILRNLPHPQYNGEDFYIGDEHSAICAFVKNGVTISLDSSSAFSSDRLTGTLAGQACVIRNISNESHIQIHSDFLGRRIYEKSPKHGLKTYFRAGERISAMDLSDDEAQLLLDQAIKIGERLYAKAKGVYYVFPVTLNNIYHGFRHDSLPEHIRQKIDLIF